MEFQKTTHGWADYEPKAALLDALSVAIEDRKPTVLTSQSLRSTEPVTYYDVHPYAIIVYHKQSLYLIARSVDHREIRTFKVDRISAVDVQPPCLLNADFRGAVIRDTFVRFRC